MRAKEGESEIEGRWEEGWDERVAEERRDAIGKQEVGGTKREGTRDPTVRRKICKNK